MYLSVEMAMPPRNPIVCDHLGRMCTSNRSDNLVATLRAGINIEFSSKLCSSLCASHGASVQLDGLLVRSTAQSASCAVNNFAQKRLLVLNGLESVHKAFRKESMFSISALPRCTALANVSSRGPATSDIFKSELCCPNLTVAWVTREAFDTVGVLMLHTPLHVAPSDHTKHVQISGAWASRLLSSSPRVCHVYSRALES